MQTHAEAFVELQAVKLSVLPELKTSDSDTPKFTEAAKVLPWEGIEKVMQNLVPWAK